MTIHDVFHVSLLKLTKEPLFKQVDQVLKSFFIDEEKKHEVQTIVNSQYWGKKIMYKIHWESYSSEHNI